MDAELTVWEMVSLFAGFYARPRDVAETIDQVGLAAKRRARVRTLSGSQLRRLDLALALIGDRAGTVIGFQLPAHLRAGQLPAGPWDQSADRAGEYTMHTDEPTRVLLALTQWAAVRGVELPGLTVTRPTLEDAYLRITGQAGVGAGDDR